MKFVVAMLAAVMTTGAFAQKHMVTVDGSELAGLLEWSSTKERGGKSTESKDRELTLNYAYALTDKIQVGGNLEYRKQSNPDGSREGQGFQIGGIYNHGADIRSSYYASLFTGMNWTRESGNGNVGYESIKTTVAVGKRIPLSMLNLENVVYSPELAWESVNPTKSDDSVEWEQGLTVKFLNFSVFF